MPRRTVALALFFLLFTSFKGQPSESGMATATELAGSPLAAAPSAGTQAAARLVSPWTPTELVIPRIGVETLVDDPARSRSEAYTRKHLHLSRLPGERESKLTQA